MSTAPVPTPTSYAHIVKRSGVREGRACTNGTRVSVKDVVFLHRSGHTPQEMLTWFSSRPLTLAEVYAALAYYYDNTDEIDAEFVREDAVFDRLDRQWTEYAERHDGAPPGSTAPARHPAAKPFPWPPER
jgi:uncharacterized protein (DUF433 family)